MASAKRAATGLSVAQFTAPAGAADHLFWPCRAVLNHDVRIRWRRASRLPPATLWPRLRRVFEFGRSMCQEWKSPEAARTVAGGASASERPPGIHVMFELQPRQGSRRVSASNMTSAISGETPRPLTGSGLQLHMVAGGRSLALAPPATVRAASGGFESASPTTVTTSKLQGAG